MRIAAGVSFKSLARLHERLLAYPRLLILLACFACGFSLNYTIENLGINTDTTAMLSQELPFQLNRKRLIQAFPQDDQAILVVVDSESPVQTSRALSYLGKQLRAEKSHVESVYIPGEGPFFERHSLLYLELDELEELAGALAEAQPFIGRLSQDNSLNGLFSIIGLAITTVDFDLPIDIAPLLDKIREAFRSGLEGKDYQLSWHDLMSRSEPDLLTTQRFILAKPKLDFSELMPAEKSLQVFRAIANNAKKIFPLVRIRLTGEIALEHEELESVSHSATVASLFSLVLVCTALLVGLRSLKLMVATLVSLVIGLILTAGFATLAVGHLNLISIAFAVLYIGLSVDYAIHYCLRYREMLQKNLSPRQALTFSNQTITPSITLCAITTSAGFYAFVPTAYSGVSELGIIAGTGMLIGLAVTLTVLPAMLKILPLKSVKPKSQSVVFADWIYRFPFDYRTVIRWSALVFSISAVALLTKVSFDFNPVNLRDPNSESVSTFKDLLKTKETSPMTLTVLAADKADALATAEKLETLGPVENAITIFDFVPDDQEEKLAIIEELALLVGLQLTTYPQPQEDTLENRTRALKEFLNTINKSLESKQPDPLLESLRKLRRDLEHYLESLESLPLAAKKENLDKLQSSLLDSLPDTMDSLLKGLEADLVTIDELPKELYERWSNEDGIYRIMIFPSEDLNDLENLKEFISDVQQLEPDATDLPAIYLESGKEIVKAFQQALIGALAAITVILMIVQHKITDTLLILMPLLMAAIFTCAAIVLFGNSFNFANIIAIPLLFGLGVDSGIHIIRRLRNMPNQDENLLHTSTARAIFFSGLTTLFSFISLAFTSHLGLASMGQLLAIGISLIVFCTLVVLPAFAINN